LKRFPKTEWSGPAWYKLEDEEWNLVYFIPIDLGSHGATEFKGKELLKVMKEVQKTVDITGCFQGIIHSHHGLGAFHSGTDDTELKEGANKVGYPSLVVAHTGATHAFKYSYEDQFENIHLEKGEVCITTPEYEPKEIWVNQADKIEKTAKKRPQIPSLHHYNGNQGNLWHNRTDGSYIIKRYNGWGAYTSPQDEEYSKEYEKMQNAEELFKEKKMSKTKYEKRKKKWEEYESEHFGII